MGNNCTSAIPVRPSKATGKEGNIQDNARSYKSKIGGMRLVLRNAIHRRDFIKYLGSKKLFIEVYDELGRLKQMKELDPLLVEVKKLLAKYPNNSTFAWNKNKLAVGACLEPIRFYDDEVLSLQLVIKNLQWAEESVLAGVTAEFEEFIKSEAFTRRGTVCFADQAPLLSTSMSSKSQSEKPDEIRAAAGVTEMIND